MSAQEMAHSRHDNRRERRKEAPSSQIGVKNG
jgi:hypothetical protein